jgi:hypothetical protein
MKPEGLEAAHAKGVGFFVMIVLATAAGGLTILAVIIAAALRP